MSCNTPNFFFGTACERECSIVKLVYYHNFHYNKIYNTVIIRYNVYKPIPGNYLMCSRVTKVILCSHGFWIHILKNEAPKGMAEKNKHVIGLVDEDKCSQEEKMFSNRPKLARSNNPRGLLLL